MLAIPDVSDYRSHAECVEVGMHLTERDGHGYCTFCGE